MDDDRDPDDLDLNRPAEPDTAGPEQEPGREPTLIETPGETFPLGLLALALLLLLGAAGLLVYVVAPPTAAASPSPARHRRSPPRPTRPPSSRRRLRPRSPRPSRCRPWARATRSCASWWGGCPRTPSWPCG